MFHPRWLRLLIVFVTFLIGATSANAIIRAALPLDTIIASSEWVFIAKVEKIDAAKPSVTLTVQDDLKAKAPFRRMPIDFKGDSEAKKLEHVPKLLKRLAPDLPVVLFINERAKRYTAYAYTNGTWFQLIGQPTKQSDQVVWSLTHGEPFLRGTFKGTTEELHKLLVDNLAGKGKLPGENTKEKPGFGPEIPASPTTGQRSTWPAPAEFVGVRASSRGALFGVIPTLGVGAPLLVLAALFPAVFGGVLILFRQWFAFITVFSVNSTLLLLHWAIQSYWPGLLRGTWIGTDAGLWFLMTLVALGGTVWAWRRQLAQPGPGETAADVPRRTELTVLWSLTGAFVLASVLTPLLSWYFANRYDFRVDLAAMSMLVLTLGVVTGALYRTAGPRAVLATEGVMIVAILLGHVGYTAYRWGGEELGTAGEPLVSSAALPNEGGLHAPTFTRVRWQFSPKNLNGLIVAAPRVRGGDVYAAAAGPAFKQGTLFCLDRMNGGQKWEFLGEDGDLKQMISGPVVAGNHVYMGEGFHDDPDCRMFCINAEDGKLAWAYRTSGQTECTPCVAHGNVYFGAGNDGIYCLHASTGKEPLWRFPRQPQTGRLMRCGSTPVVVDHRLYAGSAVDRNATDDPGETAIFCLDADSGTPHWKRPVPLPVWAAPVVDAGKVYYALGNGDVFSDAEQNRAGMVMCVDAKTGDETWRYETPNGVLDSPVLDESHVYFSCRDGEVYCVGRHDGKLRWKTALGAPMVAAPALARCAGYPLTAHVFAVATSGKVACLDPATGAIHWSLALTEKGAHFSATPRVVVDRTDGGDRRLLYVAGGVGSLVAGRPVVYCLEDFVKVD